MSLSFLSAQLLVLATSLTMSAGGPTPLPQASEGDRGPDAVQEFFAKWWGELGFPMSWEDRVALNSAYQRMPKESTGRGSVALALPGWRFVGPLSTLSHAAYKNQEFAFGRVNYFEDLPGTLRFRIAAPTGGLWEIDGSVANTIPLSETIDAPFGLVCGAFATDPHHEDRIIMGSGLEDYPNGSGLWRTVNRGLTWTSIPVANELSIEPSTYYRIKYDPSNSLRVHLATDTGLWLSTNGGVNFTRIMNAKTTEILFVPWNPQVVYTVRATGKDSSGIYRSIDGGDTYTRLAAGGAPIDDVARTSLAVQPSTSPMLTTIYASVDRNSGPRVYKSDNDGGTWIDITPAVTEGMIRGWYNNTIAVDPTFPDRIAMGWLNLYWSSDHGQSWKIADGLHNDFHTIGFDDGSMFVGNDAGLLKGRIPGENQTDFNWDVPVWFPIVQAYETDISPLNPDWGIFAMQDNGVATTIHVVGGTPLWRRGGDAGSVAIDPDLGPWWAVDLSDTLGPFLAHNYTGFNGGQLWEDRSSGLQSSPKMFRQVRSPRVAIVGRRIVTYSGDKIYGSTDDGINWVELNSTPFDGQIQDIAIADTRGDNIWGVTDKVNTDFNDRVVYRMDDGTWAERSQTLPNGLLCVRVAPADPIGYRPQEAYAIIGPGTATAPSDGKRLFFTDDAGLTWQNLTGNIPAQLPLFDVVENSANPKILYLATPAGVLKTTNRGATWFRWNMGWAPGIIVTRLQEIKVDGITYLYATSFGRGLWRRDISEVLAVTPEIHSTPIAFGVRHNPAREEAHFHFELADPATITLEVFDIGGRCLKSLQSAAVRGSNIVRWSGRDDAGNPAANGVYFAKLRTPHESARVRFVLVR